MRAGTSANSAGIFARFLPLSFIVIALTLFIQQVPADGNCLFNAVVTAFGKTHGCKFKISRAASIIFNCLKCSVNARGDVGCLANGSTLRAEVAKYMAEHEADFAPFIEGVYGHRHHICWF